MAETRLPISVCIIAGNEAHRIRRALESVANWTSEIIVVLNKDVNDGTDKIAESFGGESFLRTVERVHCAKKFRGRKSRTAVDSRLGRRRSGFAGIARRKFMRLFCRAGNIFWNRRLQFSALHVLLRTLDSPRRLVSRSHCSALASRDGVWGGNGSARQAVAVNGRIR